MTEAMRGPIRRWGPDVVLREQAAALAENDPRRDADTTPAAFVSEADRDALIDYILVREAEAETEAGAQIEEATA